MHKSRIIGVSGQAGSGKDTVADHLIKSHRFTRVALADPLKRFGQEVFGFTNAQLWGASHFRNEADIRYSVNSRSWEDALENLKQRGFDFVTDVLGEESLERPEAYNSLVRWFFWLKDSHPKLSPRIMLQTLGTEWGRNAVHPDIWINYMLSVAKTLLHESGDTKFWNYIPDCGLVEEDRDPHIKGVVVSDVRFPNEFKAIREVGGSVIRVLRPETDAQSLSIGIENHASETSDFSLDSFDFLVQNEKGLRELYDSVDMFMSMFTFAHHGGV